MLYFTQRVMVVASPLCGLSTRTPYRAAVYHATSDGGGQSIVRVESKNTLPGWRTPSGGGWATGQHASNVSLPMLISFLVFRMHLAQQGVLFALCGKCHSSGTREESGCNQHVPGAHGTAPTVTKSILRRSRAAVNTTLDLQPCRLAHAPEL